MTSVMKTENIISYRNQSTMFCSITMVVMVYCVNKSHSYLCEKHIKDPEPTSFVCFTNFTDWIRATEERENGGVEFTKVDEGQFILYLKDNEFIENFEMDYKVNNIIRLKQGHSIVKSDCSRICPHADWIRPQEFYRIITSTSKGLRRGNITQCQGWLKSKVDDIETGCYKFTFNSFSVCYWLDTNWTITPTKYPNINTTYNDTSGIMNVTWNQTQIKPALLKLNSSSNEEIRAVCCGSYNEENCRSREPDKCYRESNFTIFCSFGPVPKGDYELFIAEAHDLRCIKRGDCDFSPAKKINLLNSQPTPPMQNSKLFVWAILIVGAVLIIIAVIWYLKLYHPAGSSSAGLEQGIDLITFRTDSLLVLYPDDCPKLHDVMKMFCNLLGCNGQCKVYNILDRAMWGQVLNDGPNKWLIAKLTEVDKVVLVETHVSHILHYTEARYSGKHDNVINASLAQFYRNWDETLSMTESCKKLIRVRLNGFSPETKISPQIKLYKLHSTPPSLHKDIPYTLPEAVPLLIQHLGLDVDQGELEEAISRFSESLEELHSYKINHRDYIQHILVQMN